MRYQDRHVQRNGKVNYASREETRSYSTLVLAATVSVNPTEQYRRTKVFRELFELSEMFADIEVGNIEDDV
jgi:hypothetical protein